MKTKRKRLKRTALLLVIVFTTVFLLSCVSPAQFETESGGPGDNEKKFPDYVFDAEKMQQTGGRGAAVGKDGYYFIIGRTLYYYDIDSRQAFPLCTKASCTHRDENCDAFVCTQWITEEDQKKYPLNCSGGRVFSDGGKLYMFSRDENYDLYLDCYSPEFTDKERLTKLTDSLAEPRILTLGDPETLMHDGWLYFVTFELDTEKYQVRDYTTSYTLKRVRIEKNAVPETLFTFEAELDQIGDPAIVRLVLSGEDVFCICMTYDFVLIEEEEGWEPVYKQQVVKYSEAEGGKLLWSYSGNEEQGFFGTEGKMPLDIRQSYTDREGRLLYLSDGKRAKGYEDMEPSNIWEQFPEYPTAIRRMDFHTGKDELFYETPYWWILESATDGTNYYIMELEDYNLYLTALDPEGKVLNRHLFAYDEAYVKELLEFRKNSEELAGHPLYNVGSCAMALRCVDSRYLMVQTSVNDYVELYGDHELPIESIYNGPTAVGLVPTEAFISGGFGIERIYAW